jgi:hypothetical protein
MCARLTKTRIGVLGTGRLGQVLATRLRDTCDVAVCDADLKKAKQFAKKSGFSFLRESELVPFSELLLLCIPASAIPEFLHRIARAGSFGHCVFLDMATDSHTKLLMANQQLRPMRIIGLKMIGQFKAVQLGIPATFVTNYAKPDDLNLIDRVFRPLGRVSVGSEESIRHLNRFTTKLTLLFCYQLRQTAPSLVADPLWIKSALTNVAIGTILDFPPDADNGYTTSVLREIADENSSSLSSSMICGSPTGRREANP